MRSARKDWDMGTLRDFFVVDADSHWSEPADLFTRHAPAAYRDRVPQVAMAELPNYVTGVPELRPAWVFEGVVMGPHSAAGVVDREGVKHDPHEALFEWPFERIHQGAYDPKARLEVLDGAGIDAQIIYPSTIGLGGQNLANIGDRSLSRVAIEIYNDAQAQVQAESGNRLIPMPLVPAWDVAACVAEAKRAASLGLRGINMTSEPADVGGPSLGDAAWDPFWETCESLQLPIHFHIGASVTAHTFHGSYTWKTHSNPTKLAIGGAMLFIGNVQVLINFVVSGIFDRHPGLKVVSVESGVGWIPFVLEAIEYEMAENAPADLKRLKKSPTQAFRENMYATFWFESNQNKLKSLVDLVGEDNILFETDYPHPTCLYPNPLDAVSDKISTLPIQMQAKILGENARKLYRL